MTRRPAPASLATDAIKTPSLGRRMLCWVYEGMLMFGVVFAAGLFFSILTQSRHALENRHEMQAFLLLVFGIYFTWFWAQGQTLAMKTWHIRVVDAQGRALTQPHALWRFVLSWLWFVPPLLLGSLAGWNATSMALLLLGWVVVWAGLSRLHPQRQFWHDAWAGTRLVDVRPSP